MVPKVSFLGSCSLGVSCNCIKWPGVCMEHVNIVPQGLKVILMLSEFESINNTFHVLILQVPCLLKGSVYNSVIFANSQQKRVCQKHFAKVFTHAMSKAFVSATLQFAVTLFFSFYNELKSGISDLGFAVFSKCVVAAILMVFRKTFKEDTDLI